MGSKYENPGSKSVDDIPAVVAALNDATRTQASIAKQFGVARSTVYEIARRHRALLRHTPINDEDYKLCIERIEAGDKYSDIAARIGRPWQSVQRIAHKIGHKRQKPLRLPANAILAAYCDMKMTVKKIAEKLGVSHESVSKMLHARGVEVRPATWRATDEQLRACIFKRMKAIEAARMFGLKPAGDFYRRWRRLGGQSLPCGRKAQQA